MPELSRSLGFWEKGEDGNPNAGFSFVHFSGGWLWPKPPVGWVIFSKMAWVISKAWVISRNLELFLETLSYFLETLSYFKSPWFMSENRSLKLFTSDFLQNSFICPIYCLGKSSGTLSYFFTIPWVIFCLSYFRLELFCQRTKKKPGLLCKFNFDSKFLNKSF